MTEPTPLPNAQRAQALASIKQREDAIRANGIKQGYADRDATWHKGLGVKSIDEAREITELRKRPTIEEMREHGRHRFHQGALLYTSLGAALAIAVGALWLFIGAEMFGRNAATGSMIARQAGNVDALEALDGPQ